MMRALVVAYTGVVIAIASLVDQPYGGSTSCRPSEDSCRDADAGLWIVDAFFWLCMWLGGLLTLVLISGLLAARRERSARRFANLS